MILSHSIVRSQSSISRWVIFLHGILGSGQNWRTFARQWVATSSEWGAVLVDLRAHGDSLFMPPPHTIDACVDDLKNLAKDLQIKFDIVVGHSFGGKVAAMFGARAPECSHVIVADSMLGAVHDPAASARGYPALLTLKNAPARFASREDFAEWVTADGHDRAIADWLGKSLVREGEAFRFKLDLSAIESMIESYFAIDAWPLLTEWVSQNKCKLTTIVGDQSPVTKPEFPRWAALCSQFPSQVVVRSVHAGHWVHAEQPKRVFELLIEARDR